MDTLLAMCRTRYAEAEIKKITEAVEFATLLHGDQKRDSGEPYITHPIEVAKILFEMDMESCCVIAGILHDVVEDCYASLSEISERFGEDTAVMVDGVTKLSQVSERTVSREERNAENLRKMLLAISKDIRVVIIKLADRLHNMRTLHFCAPEKQLRKARETINVYAPLAHRFGIGKVKCELEDLALKYIDPEAYNEIKTAIEPQQLERMHMLDSVMEKVGKELDEAGISAKINGRPKHLYSIYRKLIKQNTSIDEIYDLTAIRVIVDTVANCYAALGVIHNSWRSVPGRFKDYISTPKPNGYQSIHTTLFSDNGLPFEVQIRTFEMHKNAEYGVAAHWMYKEGRTVMSKMDEKLSWFREALDYEAYTSDAQEFISDIQFDFFSDYVFAVTPQGKIIDLPLGSTPLDFAYRIHSDIGNKTTGAKVNGAMVRLDYKLKTNDVVEIITGAAECPSRNWLNIVVTNQAKAKIKQWLKKADRDSDISDGKEILDTALVRIQKKLSDFTEEEQTATLERYSMKNMDDLYAAIGRGAIPVTQVVSKLTENIRKAQAEAEFHEGLQAQLRESENKPMPKSASHGVEVKGMPTVSIRFSHCCNPLPGDSIFGYITRGGKGVSVHRDDCTNAKFLKADSERIVEVEWQTGTGNSYVVCINIIANERTGILADISKALLGSNIDLKYINADADHENKAHVRLAFEIEDLQRLKNIMNMLRSIESVLDVYRVNS
ncbi:MAG: bifunctional (p)ppGpp synthetase/guanosine-3',5'-bis(diphosphate) 3'-pyrophosphohydrolase [Clostridia bacterium]|nr:bifunctional (p)ppGpp synthetase/guanosine-3',5'-bis(diphosphate) 3'-pyrophosphohydrolase [Clostridia bacterium]